jgi:uncharacterized protein
MKYLVVILVIVVVGWLAIRGRSRPALRTRGKPSRERPQPMAQCRHCGIHLPRGDAVVEVTGDLYCCEAHRLAGPR